MAIASAVAERVPAGRKRRRSLHAGTGRKGYVFIAPFIGCFGALFLLPLGYAAYLSLFRDQLVGGTVFAGLKNYTQVLGDAQFRAGALRVLLFFVMQVPLMLLVATFTALAIDSGLLRAAKVFRLGIFVPYAVPSVVAALMWGYLYGPDFGPLTQLAHDLHVAAPDFLGSTLMLPALGNIVTWEFTGYNMIILYAALRTIPSDLYEAAAVDGAGAVRTAWSIKLPAMRPALLLCLIFSVIGSFQLFAEPNLMQRLSPTVIDAAYTPNLYAYSLAFTSQQVNYSATVSILLGLVILLVSYAVMIVAGRRMPK